MEFDKDNKKEGSKTTANADNLTSNNSSSLQPPPLQLKVGEDEKSNELPHNDQLQSAFGNNDMSSVEAHTSRTASKANESLGASAYASGSSVVFAGGPNLPTAAHEAAHTVQQGKRQKEE